MENIRMENKDGTAKLVKNPLVLKLQKIKL